MYFESWADAMAMAGHGPYVWSAYGITGVVLVTMIVSPLRRASALRAGIRAELRRKKSATGEVTHAS